MEKRSQSDHVVDEETAQNSITSLADPSAQTAETVDEKLDEGQNIKCLEQWNTPRINVYRYLVCSL